MASLMSSHKLVQTALICAVVATNRGPWVFGRTSCAVMSVGWPEWSNHVEGLAAYELDRQVCGGAGFYAGSKYGQQGSTIAMESACMSRNEKIWLRVDDNACGAGTVLETCQPRFLGEFVRMLASCDETHCRKNGAATGHSCTCRSVSEACWAPAFPRYSLPTGTHAMSFRFDATLHAQENHPGPCRQPVDALAPPARFDPYTRPWFDC